MEPIKKIVQTWLSGIRFYIALGIVAITLEAVWLTQSLYGSSNLATIRLEETFGWLSIGFLSTALLIGPLLAVFGQLPGRKLLFESRRLFGIGTAWFALLHGLITYVGQFKSVNPLEIPFTYQRAFLVGGVALVILLALAATSFDRALTVMGVWWLRLHRLVYVAAAFAVLHVVLIGVHAKSPVVIGGLSLVSLAIIFGHVYRINTRKMPPNSRGRKVKV